MDQPIEVQVHTVKILGIRQVVLEVEPESMASVQIMHQVGPDHLQVTCVQQVQQGLLDRTRDQVAIKEAPLEDAVLYHPATSLLTSEIILWVELKDKTECPQDKDMDRTEFLPDKGPEELLKDLLQILDFMVKETGFHQIGLQEAFQT